MNFSQKLLNLSLLLSASVALHAMDNKHEVVTVPAVLAFLSTTGPVIRDECMQLQASLPQNKQELLLSESTKQSSTKIEQESIEPEQESIWSLTWSIYQPMAWFLPDKD